MTVSLILFALVPLDRRKPQDKRRRLRVSGRQELLVYKPMNANLRATRSNHYSTRP
jgi:hypothetical protein